MHRMKKRPFALAMALGLILGAWGDHVALLNGDGTAPVQVFPYRLEVLPDADQQALREGIPIRDQQELSQLIQDLLS